MELLQYPDYKDLWKSALAILRTAGIQPGHVITHQQMRSLIGLPDPASLNSYDEIKTAQLAYVYSVEKIRNALLQDDCIDLQNERKVGYVYVQPGEQTAVAMEDMQEGMKKVLRKTARRVSFVDHNALTMEERKENADALARLSFFRKTIKTPTPIKEIEA